MKQNNIIMYIVIAVVFFALGALTAKLLIPANPMISQDNRAIADGIKLVCNESRTVCSVEFSQNNETSSFEIRNCDAADNNLIECKTEYPSNNITLLEKEGNTQYILAQSTEVCNCSLEGDVYALNLENGDLKFETNISNGNLVIKREDITANTPAECRDLSTEKAYSNDCVALIDSEMVSGMIEELGEIREDLKIDAIKYYKFISANTESKFLNK